jgi:hypothetical protein
MTSAMESDEFRWFVGIDWGTAEHVVTVGDATGRVVEDRPIKHTGAGLEQLLDWLTEVSAGQLAQMAVAIEIPRGAVVELVVGARGRGVRGESQTTRSLPRIASVWPARRMITWMRRCSAARCGRIGGGRSFRRLALDEPLVIRVRELTRASEVLQGGVSGADESAAGARAPDCPRVVDAVRRTRTMCGFGRWWSGPRRPALGASLRRRKVQTLLTTSRSVVWPWTTSHRVRAAGIGGRSRHRRGGDGPTSSCCCRACGWRRSNAARVSRR